MPRRRAAAPAEPAGEQSAKRKPRRQRDRFDRPPHEINPAYVEREIEWRRIYEAGRCYRGIPIDGMPTTELEQP